MLIFGFAFLISLVIQNEASRILAIFPTPSISHQVAFRPLILELVKRGHDVVMVTTDPMFETGKAPANLTEIDVHDMSYEIWRKGVLNAEVTSGNKDDLEAQAVAVFNQLNSVFEKQMLTREVQAILKDKSRSFDLLLLEGFYAPLLGLSYVYNVPVIQVNSFGSMPDNLMTVGAPNHHLVHPSCIVQRIVNLTLWEKVSQAYKSWKLTNAVAANDIPGDLLIKRLFGPDVPPLRELRNNVDMVFLNVHPIWEVNRPVPPNVIYMGGIHQKPEKELPQELKNYLDSSKNGVIYVSFGTNVEPALLPPEKIQALINAFSKLPYDILWKWNKDELPGRTANMKISKWLPQSDLLKHPKVKLFVTQGGLQSTDEAITAGVPLVGIPMLGDQWFNVELYVLHKIGVRVDMDTITAEKVETALQTVLNDKSYRENIVRLRRIMRDQPETPLERAIWWTEYVLRHGGAKHLRSPSANMSLFEYLQIELILYLISGIVSVILLVGYAIYYLWKQFNDYHRVSVKFKSS